MTSAASRAISASSRQRSCAGSIVAIDGSRAPEGDRLFLLDNGTGEATPGWYYPYGSTGLCALGEGYFYVSQDGRQGEDYDSHLTLCRWDGQTPFSEVK